MFVVRRHFPLWLYDSLKPLHCLSPYPLCLGMRFTPSISEKAHFPPLICFLQIALVPIFLFFSTCLFADANACWGNKGTRSPWLSEPDRRVPLQGPQRRGGFGCSGFLCDARVYLRPSAPAVIPACGCVCLGSPGHKSTALQAGFKNENISEV